MLDDATNFRALLRVEDFELFYGTLRTDGRLRCTVDAWGTVTTLFPQVRPHLFLSRHRTQFKGLRRDAMR